MPISFIRFFFILRTVFIFLLFCFQCSFAQNASIDSLDLLLSKETKNSNKLELLEDIVTVASNTDLKKALIYARQAVTLANNLQSDNWKPKFNEMKGSIHANLLELDSASHHFDKALSGYAAIDDKKGQATTLFKIGWVYKKGGALENAMQSDLKALRLMESINDIAGIAGAHTRISEDLYRQERYKESLEYALKNIEFCKKNDLNEELVYSYTNAGSATIGMHQPKKSFMYFDKALTLAKSLGFNAMNLCDFLNNRGNALKRLGKYSDAMIDYQEALTLSKQTNYRNASVTVIANLGEINLLTGNYPEALKYQLQTVNFQEEDKDLANLTENYGHISTIYEKMGNYPLALEYQKKARTMRDSTAKAESDKTMSNLLTQYETEKKESTIASQKTQLTQQRLVQWLSVGVAFLLLGFLFVGYRSYMARTKTNKLLAAKNQQNELLLKEIHHRVKNNLELVKSLIALQSAQLEDSATKDAMIASQNRVQSMGIIHQKLYQGENLGSIEMKDYFLNLGEGILDTFDADDKVKIECAMDRLELDVDTAVPIGLIVNELLTNALKYAFPEGANGNISISLSKSNPETLTLKVVDNGIGKTAGLAPKGTGFGSQLIKLLTQQLNGKMTEENQNGTSVLFHFKLHAACILLLFCLQLSFAQKPKTTLDSAVDWVTTNVTVYKDSTLAYQKAHKTLKAVLKNGDTSLIAQSYANLANWHSYHFYIFKTPDSILYYDKKALELYVSLKDTVKSIELQGNIISDYISRKQYNLAEKEAFKTIALCKASKNELSLALNYINLADIYTLTHNTVSAVQYADKGILLIKKLNNKEELGFAYSATIETYLQDKDYQKVLQQSNETIRIFKELGIGDNDILKAYNGRGSAYKNLGEYDKALKDFLYVLTEAKKLYGDAIGGGYAHYVGETYLAQENYEAALPYLNEGVTYAITFNEPNFLWRRYEALSNCLKHLNQYAEALKYNELAEVLKDSMHKETIKSLQSELLVKYETAQKDETITAQDSQIAQQRKTQLLYVGIAVLLALGLMGMYFSLKNIRKKRKTLQALNIELDSKNQQNELLLKEIHHRVKNNLELVKSLIALQSAQLENSTTKDAMIASQNRVQSMGIIHQKLYQGENLGSIEMKDYFLNLGEGILDTFDADDKVKIECAMDRLELDVDTAVPIGLIVNELLTNALKYAFPENAKGNISISLSKSNPETLTLKVVDNGIGKTAGLAPKGTGFGSQLIKLLTQQLNGEMKEENQNGTSVLFHFRLHTAA
ncbi:histidine kinase dimerization/phosphoacceptor domain -containing protein [Mariniflexile sp.]|uniref:histidine kinase dimerization/phosphoacceptor domain -containing protein n=1 Tax=Mariniflexile sp. TaxID=1979402 RepID=UPI0040479E91